MFIASLSLGVCARQNFFLALCSRWDLVLDFDIDTDWRMDQLEPFNDCNPPESLWAPLPPRYALKLHRQIRRFAPLYEQAELSRQAAVHSRKSDNGRQRSISPYRIRPASTSLLSRPDYGRSFSSNASTSSSSSTSTSIGSSSSISTSHGSEITFKPIDLPQDASESLRLLAAREANGSSRSTGNSDGATAAAPDSNEGTGKGFGSKSKASLSDRVLDSSRTRKSRAATKKSARSILTLTVLNVIEGSDSDSDHAQSDDDDSSDALDHRWLVVPNMDLLQGGDNNSQDEESPSSSSPGADTGSDASPWSAETPPSTPSSYSQGVDSQKTRLYSLRKAFFAVLSSLLKGYREFIKTEERLRAATDQQGAANAPSPSKPAAPVEAPMPKNFLASLTSSMRPGALGEAVDKPSAFQFAEEYAMEEVFDAAGFVAMREASSAEDWHLKHFLTIFLKQVKLFYSL